MRLLLIEDDALLADGLARSLRQAGYAVDWVRSGVEADRWLEAQEYAAAILDLGLPGMEGAEVLRRLRARKRATPVLVLSAREALDERVRLLDLGADDYLVKPAAFAELEARLRALLRRNPVHPETEIRIGALRLDSAGRRAWLGDAPLDLTAREWAMLEYLAARPGRIVSKEQLLQSQYGWDEEITPNAVEKLVSRLRTKLDCAGVAIRTVRGLGYLLEKPADGHIEKP
jgi:two-component system OmpR family response regulator